MRKRTKIIWSIVLIVFVVIIIVIVASNKPGNAETTKKLQGFVLIEDHYIGNDEVNLMHQRFFYDPETTVLYTSIDGGPLTVVVNMRGKPRLYEP